MQEQIRVAAGEKLRLRQRDVVRTGHAIECRINAEDPFKFTPSPGRITNWHPPGGPGVRVDSHAYNGYFVPPNYDSMIGKVICYGDTREQALARMRIALSEMVVEGIQTNIPLHRELLMDEKFVAWRHQHPLPGKAHRGAPGCLDRVLVEVTLRIDAEHAELLADALLACGALSVAVEDADADTPDELPLFGEPGLEPDRLAWQHSRLRVLVEGDHGGGPARGRGGGCVAEAGHAGDRKLQPGRRCRLGARNTGSVSADTHQRQALDRAHLARSAGTHGRSPCGSIPAWHSAPAPIRRHSCAWPGSTSTSCRGHRVLDYGCGSGILVHRRGEAGRR